MGKIKKTMISKPNENSSDDIHLPKTTFDGVMKSKSDMDIDKCIRYLIKRIEEK